VELSSQSLDYDGWQKAVKYLSVDCLHSESLVRKCEPADSELCLFVGLPPQISKIKKHIVPLQNFVKGPKTKNVLVLPNKYRNCINPIKVVEKLFCNIQNEPSENSIGLSALPDYFDI
jgi:hypothetical protein